MDQDPMALPFLFLITLIAALHRFFSVCPTAQLIPELLQLSLIFHAVFLFRASWVMSYFTGRRMLINGLPAMPLPGYGAFALHIGAFFARWSIPRGLDSKRGHTC